MAIDAEAELLLDLALGHEARRLLLLDLLGGTNLGASLLILDYLEGSSQFTAGREQGNLVFLLLDFVAFRSLGLLGNLLGVAANGLADEALENILILLALYLLGCLLSALMNPLFEG